jgi:hypothetical protein
MAFEDFNARGEGNSMETMLIGGSAGRQASCPKLEICEYAQKGLGLFDRERFENCGHCHWDYENCRHYKGGRN